MHPGQTFTIIARIDHLSDGVGCFDPVQVVTRMRVAFPNLIEHRRDYLWETCDFIRKSTHEGAEGALRIAVKDMQERGPKIQFEIPLEGGRLVKGTAERYCVLVTAEEDFPEDFRGRFMGFLKSLRLQSIEVSHDVH
ncbi:MAG TPA: hypothetical protein VG796_24630 [Verrucomicrobiales bacterium]|jgi:hypothetical protein|nr:hypothetical protein [Verrucomicrobiales bacterium]